MPDLVFTPRSHLQGHVDLPADKSILHRALMLNALAEGESSILACHYGDDNQTTINALRSLGIAIDVSPTHIHIHGNGKQGLRQATQAIDCGNSGTTMRLLAGILAAQGFNSTLVGDDSLRKRPMQRVVDPLSKMGAKILSQQGCAPLTLTPSTLQSLHYTLPIASAQVKSALLLAGLMSGQEIMLHEPQQSRDHTERLFQAMQIPLKSSDQQIHLPAHDTPIKPLDIQVPGDFSAAAFFITAACLATRADVTISAVNVNPTRTGLLRYLILMGVPVQMDHQRWFNHEPVADIHIKTVKRLQAVTVRAEHIPSLIDELPLLFLLAAKAQGTTIIPNVSELRHKECDRLTTMITILQTLGVNVQLNGDRIAITGADTWQGGTFDCMQDHRIAMTLAVASVATKTPVIIDQGNCYRISFPRFLDVCRALSMQYTVSDRS